MGVYHVICSGWCDDEMVTAKYIGTVKRDEKPTGHFLLKTGEHTEVWLEYFDTKKEAIDFVAPFKKDWE